MYYIELMYLTGICVSQGVAVRMFQSNDDFHFDLHPISVKTYDGHSIIRYINELEI